MAEDSKPAEKPQKAPSRPHKASEEKTTAAGSTEKTTDAASAASEVREVAQDQPDRVAIVSRTSTGEAHQSPGYEVVGLPEDADEATKAAAENRPEKS